MKTQTDSPVIAQHTPGPWHDYEHSTDQIMVVGDRENAVAHICRSGRRVVDEANARLIAACPTMFDYIKAHAAKGDAQAQSILDSLR